MSGLADDVTQWRCGRCEAYGSLDGSWRWRGTEYEHKCHDMHPQAGHSPAQRVGYAYLSRLAVDLRAALAASRSRNAKLVEALRSARRTQHLYDCALIAEAMGRCTCDAHNAAIAAALAENEEGQ